MLAKLVNITPQNKFYCRYILVYIKLVDGATSITNMWASFYRFYNKLFLFCNFIQFHINVISFTDLQLDFSGEYHPQVAPNININVKALHLWHSLGDVERKPHDLGHLQKWGFP